MIGALQQQITYNEFLPMVLGREVMENHDLMLLKHGYLDKYDPNLNPSVATGFTSAGFRQVPIILRGKSADAAKKMIDYYSINIPGK